MTLSQLGYTAEINSTSTMKSIVNRFPFHMNTKWTEYATGIIKRTKKEATFKDLVTFVQQRAETASNTWGENLQSLSSAGRNSKQSDTTRRVTNRPTFQRATFATEVNTTESTVDARSQPKDTSYKTKCTFCSGKHFIAECTTFKAKQVDERCAFVKDNNLCFNCLIPYHSARKCHRDSKCTKCEFKHHWLCHRENFQPERRANDNDARRPGKRSNGGRS